MIVNSVAYQQGRVVARVASQDIHDYLGHADYIVWVAVRDPDHAELEQLRQEFNLQPLAVEDALHGHQRPKFEEYSDSLFFVIHTVEIDGEELRIGEINIFVTARYVLTIRKNSDRNLTEVRTRCENEPTHMQYGTGYILYALMDAIVDRYFPIIDGIASQLEHIEDRIFAGESARQNIESLYYLKQQLVTLKHATAPLLEAVGKLYGGRVPAVCAGLDDYFRDVADHLVRINQLIDATRDMVATAISVSLAMITVQDTEVTKQLAGYGALVAVPTMIAGIYGMNFQHMPELSWTWGYPMAVLSMVIIDLYLFYRFRKSRWL
jgi:magnesium transporter